MEAFKVIYNESNDEFMKWGALLVRLYDIAEVSPENFEVFYCDGKNPIGTGFSKIQWQHKDLTTWVGECDNEAGKYVKNLWVEKFKSQDFTRWH